MNTRVEPWRHPQAPGGVDCIRYAGAADGAEDWALARRPDAGTAWVVHLHGHGSTGDQIFTRADLRERWLPHYLRLGLGILSPNLRGNAWMCPAAVDDLHGLLELVRRTYGARAFYFLSGSMGGTGNLVYAVRHPGDVALAAALCPVTSLAGYHAWLAARPGGIRDEIRVAIESAYGGSPGRAPEGYAAHDVVAHTGRLTMPILLSHAVGDGLIPVDQSRRLRERMGAAGNLTYVEIDGGDHDTPLFASGMTDWLEARVREGAAAG